MQGSDILAPPVAAILNTVDTLLQRLRARWASLRNPRATVQIDRAAYVGPGFTLYAPHGGTFRAGPGVEFRRGFLAELEGPGSAISIGARSVFTYDVILQCTSSIEIGEQCSFGQAALVADSVQEPPGHGGAVADQSMNGPHDPPRAGVRIADHVSIAPKCTVTADVGEHTFVEANSSVTRALPARCRAGGVPAQVLDMFDDVGPTAAQPHEGAARRPRPQRPAGSSRRQPQD